MGELSFTPVAASEFAQNVDLLFIALFLLTVLFCVIVFALTIGFVAYYRRGNKVNRKNAPDHNVFLELFWSVIPLGMALVIFVWATQLFATTFAPPKNAKEIFVIGKQWMWHIQHSNGRRENNELHLSVGEPIKLTMISQDVIHAFFVPEFRIQRHVEPGNYTVMYVTPTKPGKYHLYCNMYCGTQHSQMGGWVYVMSKKDYADWAVKGGSKPVAVGGYDTKLGAPSLAQQGASMFEKYDCASCHNAEGVKVKKAPTLTGIYGTVRNLTNGANVVADDAYLRNVLINTDQYIPKGWEGNIMPSYKNVLKEEEVLAINAYIKSLDGKSAPVTPVGEVGTSENNAADTENQQWRYMYGGEQYK
jgi:cytochrome c oxidase subunit II